MPAAVLLHLLLISTSIRPLSSAPHRRILHQPFQPQDSIPPSPSPPSPPNYPFSNSNSNSTPNTSPFFPSYPSPPPPPSPSSFASFPANISSLAVPRPSSPSSAPSKLIIAAAASVLAAVAVVSLAVFLHLRRRTRTRRSPSKTLRSDHNTTASASAAADAGCGGAGRIPKLQRPSQTSSEFLYLGTLVSSHASVGGVAFNNYGGNNNNASISRKTDSPELRPLPPLNTNQIFRHKDDESEEFYSPRGSINGSIGTGSASRRAFTAIEVENYNDSISDSSSTCSSSCSPVRSISSSLSPANNYSIPKSPDLIEIRNIAPAAAESASPSPPSSSSPERCSRRSEESSPMRISSSVIQTPPEIRDSSPRVSNASDRNEESSVRMNRTSLSTRSDESSRRNSNVESPVRISNPIFNPSSPEMQALVFPAYASPLQQSSSSSSPETERRSRSVESSPRISNVSDKNVESMMSLFLPERDLTSEEESSPSISNGSDHNLESSVSIPAPLSTIPPPPPPPPPLPPSRVWESPRTPTPPSKKTVLPPALVKPLGPISVESPLLISPIELPSNDPQMVKNEEDKESPNKETEYSSEESASKPKLKPLHWDKVRASSDREMVWDQFKSSSFKLNEEMIETLFVVNTPKPNPKEASRWQVLPSPGQDNGDRVLDPKKAQNIAILLKALHVTVDEVCEGLLEGNADILGTELLESLLKMAPTKEEERKLKEHKDDSPIKLGAAEKFLKAVVDIPYAFKRVAAMLYISNFESEVEYLKRSFATLEAACEELRTSRMFLKLLEAVLKTGNRMNVGTNRGDAHAFKLDTLLKLVDVKGADGKTTLLHFVVQEIIRSEGARLSSVGGPHENSSNDEAKCRKLGLQVVSALGSELSNVKKAAVMEAEVINSDVIKLSKGIENVREIIITLNEDGGKFSGNMNSFVKRAEEEIFRIQAQESVALSLVKEITEYFHGNSAKEEAHPFRIFMVVREFVTILDRVCKEVGMINERTIVSYAHKFPVPVNPMLQKRQSSSSDDESLPFNV